MSVVIRVCEESDLGGLNDLYNWYIRESPATFDIVPISIAQRREWFRHYGRTGRHRVLVGYDGDRLVGYCSSSSFRPKQAYETSIETTVYVAQDAHRNGVGTRLYSALFAALEGEDIHRALAGITAPNDASFALHEKFGFKRVAYFTEQGRKFDKYWDVAWFEKEL